MSEAVQDDVHAPHINALMHKGDWAGLVRYWIAHRHEPALVHAVALARSKASTAKDPWGKLADFLTKVSVDPLNRENIPPTEVVKLCNPKEAATLQLLGLYPLAALGAKSHQAPAEFQRRQLADGLKAAGKAIIVAQEIADHPVRAVFRMFIARAQDRAGSYRIARTHYRKALAIYRPLLISNPEVYGPYVAKILDCLGDANMHLGAFNAAILVFQQGLKIWRKLARKQPEEFLEDVASCLNCLAYAQEVSSALEAALTNYTEAMEIWEHLAQREPDSCRGSFAAALNHLGNVQLHLDLLEPAAHSYQKAIALFHESGDRQPLSDRLWLARVLTALGYVQTELNADVAALDSYQQALTVCRDLDKEEPQHYWPNLATALNDVGVVQHTVAQYPAARASFEEALGLYRRHAEEPNAFRLETARTLTKLGTVQRDVGERDEGLASFREAVDICRTLTFEQPERYQAALAMALVFLSTVERDLKQFPAALASLQEAAILFQADADIDPTAHLAERQTCLTNLGLLYLFDVAELGWPDFRKARDTLRQALACAEQCRSTSSGSGRRRRARARTWDVYALSVQSCFAIHDLYGELDSFKEAVEVAEASRARDLLDLLQDENLEPANTPTTLRRRFCQVRRQLHQANWALRQLEHDTGFQGNARYWPPTEVARVVGQRILPFQLGTRDVFEHLENLATQHERLSFLTRRVDQLKKRHAFVLKQIQINHDPEFDADQPLHPIRYEGVTRLIPRDVPTAVVQYFITHEYGLANVISPSGVFTVRLPDLNVAGVSSLAEQWFGEYYSQTRHAAHAVEETAAGAVANHNVLEAQRLSGQAECLRLQWLRQWEQALPGLLEQVSKRAIVPVLKELAGTRIERLILSPNRALHVFPLHACCLSDGRPLLEKFEVLYTPSLSLLERCVCRRRSKGKRLLLVQNPTGDSLFSEVEGAIVGQRYRACTVLDSITVSKRRLLQEAKVSHILHFAGHCSFERNDPLLSALEIGSRLAPGKWLTLRDIFCRMDLPENRLTILGGCESGMLLPNSTDDYVSLTTGFLFGGASCVLSTLWPVFDLPTALLMDRFHSEWVFCNKAAAALREAQRWLRDGIRSGEHLLNRVLPAFLSRLDDGHLQKQCVRAASRYAERFPDQPPFASPVYWAPFICSGMGF